MAREHAVLSEENFPIPAGAFTFEGFRRWVESDEFPESGRIDFLAGDVEVDLSPEEISSHGAVKGAIFEGLRGRLVERKIGEAFTDSTRVSSPRAGLSTEPDVAVVLWKSMQEGRCRYRSTGSNPRRLTEIEGAPDLIVEVVSDSSVDKDTRSLPKLYALAGVPELWIVDARGSGEPQFRAHTLQEGRYIPIKPDPEGWFRSPTFDLAFRLIRYLTPVATWQYVLEHRAV